jgi:hypothetical protein
MDAIVLSRLLNSRDPAHNRAALARLSHDAEHERVVELLAGILDDQERKIAACGEWKGEGWEWLILLDFVGLALGSLFGIAVGIQHLRRRRRHLSRLRRNAALALAGRGDARAFGPLVELFGWSRTASERQAFADAVERLVPHLRPGDATRALNSRQREFVARLLRRGTGRCEATTNGRVALLRALAAMREVSALPAVTEAANLPVSATHPSCVVEAAAQCRSALEQHATPGAPLSSPMFAPSATASGRQTVRHF